MTALLGEMGGKRTFANERMQGLWRVAVARCSSHARRMTARLPPVGNGTMFSLAAASREQVDTVHAKAIALGAADEGAPGLRGDTFYGAYFRDLDGNKLCVFKSG